MRETLQNGQVKTAGYWILTRMILPAAGVLVALIYILCRCVCGCCSGKASAVKAKAVSDKGMDNVDMKDEINKFRQRQLADKNLQQEKQKAD